MQTVSEFSSRILNITSAVRTCYMLHGGCTCTRPGRSCLQTVRHIGYQMCHTDILRQRGPDIHGVGM